MARFFVFFTLFHLSETFFRPEVPFKFWEKLPNLGEIGPRPKKLQRKNNLGGEKHAPQCL